MFPECQIISSGDLSFPTIVNNAPFLPPPTTTYNKASAWSPFEINFLGFSSSPGPEGLEARPCLRPWSRTVPSACYTWTKLLAVNACGDVSTPYPMLLGHS